MANANRRVPMKTSKQYQFEIKQLRKMHRAESTQHQKYKFISFLLVVFIFVLLFAKGFKVGC